MLGVNYRHSPIVGEYKGPVGGPGAGLAQRASGALTNIGGWLDFSHGPLPGDRAPDAYLTSSTDSESMRLFPHIAGGWYNLLLFAGLKASAACFDAMSKTAAAINEKYGQYVRVHFVVPGEEPPAALNKEVDVLFDLDQSFHHIYGAAVQCLYLIRPDGYVGFRSHPIELPHLIAHLQSIFDCVPEGKNLSDVDASLSSAGIK